jgi:hypothetical protein
MCLLCHFVEKVCKSLSCITHQSCANTAKGFVKDDPNHIQNDDSQILYYMVDNHKMVLYGVFQLLLNKRIIINLSQKDQEELMFFPI